MKILVWLAAVPLVILVAGALATLAITWRIEERYPPAGRFVEVAGGRLHLVERGDPGSSVTVLLIHGASGNASDPLLALGDTLAKGARVLAFDRPGHGWSDRIGGRDAHSPARQAAVLREGLRAIGVERAIVVGHSWGGAVALAMALDHAEVTQGIMLLSPVSHPWPGGAVSWYIGPTVADLLGTLFTRTLSAPLSMILLRPAEAAVFQPQSPPPDYVERARIPLVLRPRSFKANAEDIAHLHAFVTRQSRRYGEIRTPTTILAGDVDKVVWTDIHARSLEREIPGARLVVLERTGHMPHFAATGVVAAEITALAARAAARP